MKKDQVKLVVEIALAAVLAVFILIVGSHFATSKEHEEKKDAIEEASSKKAATQDHEHIAILKTPQ